MNYTSWGPQLAPIVGIVAVAFLLIAIWNTRNTQYGFLFSQFIRTWAQALSPVRFVHRGLWLNLSGVRDMVPLGKDRCTWTQADWRVQNFYLPAKNQTKARLTGVYGFIRSVETEQSIPILIDGMPPDQTHGIPGKSNFTISAIFPNSTPPREGWTIEDFWRNFGEFFLEFHYDGGNPIRVKFSRSQIQCNIQNRIENEERFFLSRKISGPRVERKQ